MLFLLGVDDEDHRPADRPCRRMPPSVFTMRPRLLAKPRHFLLGELVDGRRRPPSSRGTPGAIEALADGLEVGQRAAEPALGHVRHAAARGLFLDDVLRLLLGADEEDRLARRARPRRRRRAPRRRHCSVFSRSMMWMPFFSAKMIGLHLRVPPFGLVAEMNARFEQILEGELTHGLPFPFGCSSAARTLQLRSQAGAPGGPCRGAACDVMRSPRALLLGTRGRSIASCERFEEHRSRGGAGA